MTIAFSTAVRNARGNATIAEIDGGADAVTLTGVMHFYTATRPASGVAITTQTLLASCELSEPSGTVSNGVTTFDPISDDVAADADGDIAWCRIVDSDGAFVIDLDCGIDGSGADIIFNTITARVGGVVQILSGSFTEGNA